MLLERTIGTHSIGSIGLGCMNLSHAYGTPVGDSEAMGLLHHACDIGVKHFDTAALYGFGANEKLLGRALKGKRENIHLASKCGMTGVDGKRLIDGRPETLVKTVEASLRNLQTDFIDLYYLHRWDKSVAIEDSVGAMANMVAQGKIGAIGLSEVSAATLTKANAVHPITAVQSEYSLWTRNAEIAALEACKQLGVTYVAFSPVARGFLCQAMNPEDFAEKDIRRGMPRFQQPHFAINNKLYGQFKAIAEAAQCTPSQLALHWLLLQGDNIVPIPGTRSIAHLEENMAASSLTIDPLLLNQAGQLINEHTVSGERYPTGSMQEIDTENFSTAA